MVHWFISFIILYRRPVDDECKKKHDGIYISNIKQIKCKKTIKFVCVHSEQIYIEGNKNRKKKKKWSRQTRTLCTIYASMFTIHGYDEYKV